MKIFSAIEYNFKTKQIEFLLQTTLQRH